MMQSIQIFEINSLWSHLQWSGARLELLGTTGVGEEKT